MNRISQPARGLYVLPLVRSIVAEIRERRAAIRLLESSLDFALTTASARRQELLIRECALHRRELRRARRELEQLGCALLSLDPPIVAISSRTSGRSACVIWQP